MSANKKAVGQRIKLIRQSKGMTLEEFGNLFDASKGNVSTWEKGISLPSNKRIKKIASIGDMTVEELLHGNTTKINSIDGKLVDTLEKFIARKNGILQEIKLLAPGALSGLTFGLAFKEMSRNAIKDNEALQDRIKELKRFGYNYIQGKFNNYTFEKFNRDFPNSDSEEFEVYKEKENALFEELLENYWNVLDKNHRIYSLINSRFTNQISDELTKIIKKAIEEDREDYYIEEVVQPILNQAAKDIKESIKDYIDTED